jgi:hypothetical protein
MASITVSGIDVENVNEGSRLSYPTGLTATFDNIREVILASYPTANLFLTIFTFNLSVSGTAEGADFNASNLNISYFVRLDGSVSLPQVGTINDSAIEGDETFSLQPILNDLSIDLEDGSRIRLNPSQIEALFANAGGFTLNIGPITGTIVDNDFPNQAPTAVNFVNTTPALDENSDTTSHIKVADITITDDGQGTNVLSLSGSDAGVFELVGTTLYLKAGTTLDFETKTSYNVTVNVNDSTVGSTPDASKTFILTVNDLVENTAPTGLSLSPSSVNENVAAGTVTSTFVTTDAEGGNFTYAFVSGTGDTDNSAFTIVGNELKINNSPDFEAQSTYSIRVKTTDAGGLSLENVLTLAINDVNEAPVFSSGTTATFEENKTGIVYTASATDPEQAALSYSLAGTDAALFAIDASTGAVSFKTAPNFEAPADSNQNNVYDITVTASTAVGPSASRAVAITVNNVNEAPTVTGETVSTSQNTGNLVTSQNTVNPVTSVTVELGDNLSDPDANGLANAILNVTGATNGTIASLDQDARLVSFIPTAGFSGTASFNYTLTDAGGLTSNTATVTIDVGSVISTGNRNQEIEGNNGDDIISAGNGSDRILGLGGNDRLFGNNGNDILTGGDGNDSLFGGNGTDTLLGGNGNDLLDGGGNGPDIVTGGAGSDRFVLTASAGGDTFTDFADTFDRAVCALSS